MISSRTGGKIGVLAPWKGTENLGDLVIADAVHDTLRKLGFLGWSEIPTHTRPNIGALIKAAASPILLLGGTNILSGNLERTKQWWLTPDLVAAYRNRGVCLGVGWRSYEERVSKYSEWAMRTVLRTDITHSVRDDYTVKKLSEIGISAVNTSCPTMWELKTIDRGDFDSTTVIVTVTNYREDGERDRAWLDMVRDRFHRMLLQPMSTLDLPMLRRLSARYSATVLDASIEGFNSALEEFRPVYVGTRLHAGVRAFQRGLPGVILAIDNRAVEIARTSSLPVVETNDIVGLGSTLDTQLGDRWKRPDANTATEVSEFADSLLAHASLR